MRAEFLPYALPQLGEEEIAEVTDSLRSGWVTTGPKVQRFEEDFARYTGAEHAIAVSSCTAALHLSLAALNIGPGDEVIVPTLTFCSTANVVLHLGAKPVIVDITEDGQISPEAVSRAITRRTRAIVPVHYGGRAYPIREIHGIAGDIPVVEDAAHAAGTVYEGRRVGAHSRASAFSFYAIKNMTTGEGGMITTNDSALAARLRLLSLHGLSRDAWKRYSRGGSWQYEVLEAGYKCNMTDIAASIGIHQLRKLDGFVERRRAIAARYREAFSGLHELRLPDDCSRRPHTYHLFPVHLVAGSANTCRDEFIDDLRARNIGTSVHFIPLHRHPVYRELGYTTEQFPVAERFTQGLVSLPLYPKMSDRDVEDVVDAVRETLSSRLAPASEGYHDQQLAQSA
jgi:dTDP-4-amino-4,6-dideoxygalactose transaminase